MPADPILEKVVAFVTREQQGYTELLVFDHPTAGTQIPAGTVEANESLEEAVIREAFEETGKRVQIVDQLHPSTFDPLAADRLIALSLIRPRQAPYAEAPVVRGGWEANRGLPFQIADPSQLENGYVYATRREFDFNQSPPQLLDELGGWVPRKKMTNRQRRHYFLLELCDLDTSLTWTHVGDHGVPWCLYWVPLAPRPTLIGRQNDWLSHVIDAL